MSKQVQVNLAFNADTSKAKAQINDLVSSLNKIITKDSQIFDDRELREAANAAKDLTKHLENAVNVNTGKLDLNKFTQSLSQSKQSLSELYNSLSKAGPQGQQAFLQLASSIASSESQVLSLSSKVRDLGTTLKNTIKWQLSSSLVHGFMSAISQATGYAKDLNSSLNDIRIVTGASVDEMARFAEQANKSAKALSSTTTEYTKASLIYYQQGLSDAEVKERTDVTIKMANVSKTSAETVSDQMTAVWNNFYDGSKSLEYYADVMTALGAATASSVDEISGGLEKFAAIGDTIGLSYEYAASALATITSNTRQSEEVVGTALKTIFARIQGLNLGETLDDGTTLNKYSAALEKVGISIFDQSGEIKNMDSILDEMGNKWQDLNKDQQIALAQTVAGTRQYTQLVALMDNWDIGDSDSFQANLKTAYNSEGTLQEQQDIYAESWEAAADRVKTAIEDIYDSLLNDEAIIPILNGLENILTLVGSLIDGFGGLEGIILLVGATFTKSFAKEVPDAVNKIKTNLKIISGQAEKEKQANVKEAGRIIDNNKQDFTGGNYVRAEATVEELASLQELELIRNRITESEYAYIKSKIAEKKASQEAIAVKKDEIDQLEKEYQIKQKKASQSNTKKATKKTPESKKIQLEEEKDILGARKESLEEGRNKLLAKVHKGDSLSIKQAADLDSYNQELQAIEERNQKIRESIKLEEQRKAIIEKEGLAKKDENGEIIGIDEKKYQESITSKANQLKAEYEKQATNRLNLEDYNRQVSSWTASAGSMKLKDLGAEKQEQEVSKLKKSIEQYAAKLKEANNVQFNDEKFATLKQELEQVGISAEDAIAAFKKFASETDISEATRELEKTSTEVQQLESDLRILTGDGFQDIQTEAYEAAQEIALAKHTLEQFENEADQIDVDIKVDASSMAQTLTEVASIAMDIGTIFASLKSMFATWGDESASITDKVTTSLSSLGSVALSSIQIFSTISSPGFLDGIKNIGTTLTGAASSAGLFKGVLGKLGGAFTTAGSSASAFLAILGKFAIAAVAIWAVVKVIDFLHTSQAEANEAISEATKKYAEEKEKLDELNGSLKTTSDRIEELQSKGTLSLVEQEELNRLLEQEASLERQVALQERKAQLAKEESANAFEDNVDKASQWINTAPVDNQQHLMIYDPSTGTTVGGDQGQSYTPEEYLATINKLYTDENGNILEGYETQYEGLLNYYKEWVQNYNEELLKWIESNEEAYNTLIQGYQDWYDINKDDENKESEILANARLISDAQKAMYGDEYDEKVLGSMDNIFKASTDQKDKDVVDNIVKDLEDGIVDADPASIAAGFSDTFKESLLKQGIIPDDYAQHLIDEYTRAASALKGEVSLEDLLGSEDFNEEDLEILAHLQLTGEETLEEILAKIDAYKSNTIEVKFSVEGWSSDFDNDIKTLQELSKGDFVTKEVFDSLNPTAQSAFRDAGDRGYQLMSDNETVAANTERYYLDTLAKQTHLGKTVDSQVTSGNMESVYGKINELTQKDMQVGLSSMEQAYLQGLQDVMQDHVTNLESLTGKEFDYASDAMAYIKSDEYKSFMSDNRAERRAANEEAAFRVSNLSDIDDLQNEGLLNRSVNEDRQVLSPRFNDNGQYLGQGYQTVEGTGLNENAYTDALQTVALNHENASEELDDFRQALENGTAEQKEAAESSLLLATRAGELAEETEYSAEEIESMAKQLKSQEKFAGKSGQALAEAAKDQLRFNDAVESASENMDTWKESVKDFNKTGKLIPYEEMEQMREAYGNVLDIDGSELSDDFLTNEKNLELMEEAIYGNEDAYDELQNAAQDALGKKYNIDFDTSSLTDAALSFNDIEARMAELENDPVALDAYLNSDPVLAAMSDLVTQAGLTAEQATSLLSSMGIDATVVNKPGEEVEEVVGSSVTAEASTVPAPFMGMTIGPDGSQTVTEMEASIPVWTTSTEPVTATKQGVGTALEVTSAYGSSGGSVKSAGSGASKGSSGGGGGSSSSNKTKVDKVKKTSIVKRYKRIDDKIDDKSNAAEKASRAMDKLYGNSRIKQMQKYNQLLQEEIGLLETKKQEAEDYLKIDQKDLQSTLDDALKEAGLSKSLDFKLDDDGLITNYDEVMTKLWAKLDSMITQVNRKGGATDDEQDQIDELQDKIDAVTEAIEQYDETRELIEDIENEMAEKALEIYDNQLEALSYEIELNLELSDDSIALIDFQLSQIEDNAFKAAEAIGLMGSKAGNIEEKMAKTKDALASLTAMTLDGEYTEEQMDLIKQYRDELMDLAEEYAELREQVEEQVMAAFEGWREELDKGISTVEHAGSVLESYKNITDLLGDSLSEQVQNDLYGKFNEKIMDVAIDKIEATKATYEGIAEAQARAQAEYENALAKGDEASADMWKRTLDTLNEEAQSAQEEMLASWEEALNAIVEQFEQNVERAVNAFREQFDDLSEKFTRQKETSDMFLDDYKQIYELSKLSRDINKSIDDTESLGGKKKLKGLLEDINKLQEEGVEMSEYDLEYLQKTYDLRLAELELENAQNAKNTVRLSKDNEGNWSYVYTTNTDAVDQAQQKYEDALYAMQDLSSVYIDEMSEKLISTSQEMAEALASLRAEDFSSYQEYQDEVNRVTKEYETQLSLQEAELNKAIGNNKTLYNEDWKNYSDATGYKISETDKFVTAFRDSLLGSLMDSTTETSNFMEVLSQSSQILVNALGENGKEYFENIGSVMQAAGSSTEGFGVDATEAINATSEASKEAAESVGNMATEMVDDFDNISDAVVKWQATYSEAISQALDDTENLVGMINAMNESLVKGNGIPQGVSIDANGQASYSEDDDITANIVKQLVDMDLNELDSKSLSYALSETLSSMKVEDFDNIEEYMKAIENVQTQYEEALQNITTGQTKDEYIGQWEYLEEIMTKGSGTMGGTIPDSWAPVLADVIDKISTNAQQMSLGVGQWAAQVIKDELIQTLQQDVSIMAEFPNVSDHNEIEEAIKDLINTASQYVHRK